jgi:hypothetical protein
MKMAGLFLALAIGLAVVAAAAVRAHVWVPAIAAAVLALWLASSAVRFARHR